MPSIISIGAQLGGPESCLIRRLKVSLYQTLEKHLTSTHCEAIDEYAIVLRVDGTLDKFGEEGITRLRFAKSNRYITADVQIPESVWQPMNESQTKSYLATQVRAAISIFVARLIKEKYAVAEKFLWPQIDAAIKEFTGSGNCRLTHHSSGTPNGAP
jgi:hypothetical protein